jgi:hypothetical protein
MQQGKEGPLLLHDPTIHYIMTDELSYMMIDVNIVAFSSPRIPGAYMVFEYIPPILDSLVPRKSARCISCNSTGSDDLLLLEPLHSSADFPRLPSLLDRSDVSCICLRKASCFLGSHSLFKHSFWYGGLSFIIFHIIHAAG